MATFLRLETPNARTDKIKSGLAAFGVVFLLGLAATIRMSGLDKYYWSPDEALAILISSRDSFREIWRLGLVHTHPPLHYFMLHYVLKFSEDVFFVRFSSILAGLLLVPASYLAGRAVSGRAAGLAAATMAGLAQAPVLLSQVIRPYIWMLLLLTISIGFLAAYWKSGRKKDLLGHGLALALAMNIHYSVAMPLATMGALLFVKLMRERAGWRRDLWAGVAYLPASLSALGYYAFHLAPFLQSQGWENRVSGYLAPYYGADPAAILHNLFGLFKYCSYPPAGGAAFCLAGLGLFALVRRGQGWLSLLIVSNLLLGVLLVVAGKYPFGGLRQDAYLFPFLALAMGAGARAGAEIIAALLFRAKWLGGGRASARARLVFSASMLSIGLAGAAIVTVHSGRSDYLRRYEGKGHAEFPLLRKDLAETLDQFRRMRRENDLALCNAPTAAYLLLERPAPNLPVFRQLFLPELRGSRRPGGLYAVQTGEFFTEVVYFPNLWSYESPERFRGILKALRAQAGFSNHPRVWLLNLAYPTYEKLFSADPQLERAFAQVFSVEGSSIYVAETSQLDAALGP